MAATRRPIAVAAAVATAAALGVTSLTLPAVALDAADGAAPAARAAGGAPAMDLKDVQLDWGIKEDFRKHLAKPFVNGRTTLTGGAEQTAPHGPFAFKGGKGRYAGGATHAVSAEVPGSVRFEGYGGVLDMTFGDFKLVTKGVPDGTGEIVADFKSKDRKGNWVEGEDVAIAALDLSKVEMARGAGGTIVLKDIPAKLTAKGAAAFGGSYQEGEALDAATLTSKPVETKPEPPVDETDKDKDKGDKDKGDKDGDKDKGEGDKGDKDGGDKAVESGPVVDGTLGWGVSARFRKYVTGPIAHGKADVSDGAAKEGEGYRFTKATGSFDAAGQELNAAFAGKVRFRGHLTEGVYGLDASFSNLKVVAKGKSGTLYADVDVNDRAKPGKMYHHKALELATLRLGQAPMKAEKGVVVLEGVNATLTAAGAEKAFGGGYEKGEALDDLNLAVSLEKGATLPEVPGDSGGTGGSTDGSDSTGGTGGTDTTGGTTGGAGTTGGGSVGGGTVGGSTGGGGTVGGAGTTGGGSLAATGAGVPTGALVGASGLIVAAGAGAVWAARRRTKA